MTNKPLTHAGCVVYRDDKKKIHYLLASSSTGKHWVLPKGHIDPGETPETAALRELTEETGVLGEVIQPLSVQHYDKAGKEVIIQYYLVRMIGSTTPMENRKLRWEKKKAALKKLSFVEAQNALEDAIEIFRSKK